MARRPGGSAHDLPAPRVFMTDLNQFIASEKESMRLFIDTISNNMITGRSAERREGAGTTHGDARAQTGAWPGGR